MPKTQRKAFEINLSDDQRDELTLELCYALDQALAARSVTDQDVEYWHILYEQGRTRVNSGPWQDAADLTSYLGTQYVDVLRSQIVSTVMTDPVYTVEGYGDAAAKAPFIEEFHQWQLEEEGFQSVFARAAHLSLIEPRPVIEVYEDTIRRPVRKTMKAALQLGPDGAALVGPDMKPVLQRNPDTTYVEVQDPTIPHAEVEIDSFETVCRGPRERVIAYRDFLVLPGHATDKSEVWGYAKRFFRRLDDLRERAAAGLYDEKAVEDLGSDDERPSETTLAGEPIGVAAKDGSDVVEKELWELLILKDLDGKGLRWYIATVQKDKQILLRIQYDDIGRPRYFPLIPFPRPNSLEGYSYIGHKLITVIEEHTAWRNMVADDASMQLQLPLKRMTGALWDPDVEPIGPKSVITVRAMNEIEFMQRQSNSVVGVERIRDAERAGERLSGINDASAGVTSQDKRTLGEVELITQQSQGRTSEAVKNIQETLEDIAQVRHLLWKRALSEPQAQPIELPPSVLQGLEFRGADITNYLPNKQMTAQMFEGAFRFKPRGSVENADKRAQRNDLNQMVMALASLSKVNPMIAFIMQTPQAAKALLEQVCRLYNVQDKQAFLGSAAMGAAQEQMAAMQQMQMQQQMGGAQPGGPNSGPPGAGRPAPPPAPPIGAPA